MNTWIGHKFRLQKEPNYKKLVSDSYVTSISHEFCTLRTFIALSWNKVSGEFENMNDSGWKKNPYFSNQSTTMTMTGKTRYKFSLLDN